MGILFCILPVAFYAGICWVLTIKWKQYPRFSHSSADGDPLQLSVIIPFRNEADHLRNLLDCLDNQHYPATLFEVILSDDHSTDGSERIASDATKKQKNYRYIRNDAGEAGKKATLQNGIRAAQNQCIVTTDADCVMKSGWLETIAYFFKDSDPDVIMGLVDIKSNGQLMDRFEEVEFLSMVSFGASAAAANRPVYCNGASFAFKRNIFFSLSDPLKNRAVSGDDTFLLHAAKAAGYRIMLLKSEEATVTTYTNRSFMKYLNQRMRWASKASLYSDRDTIITGLAVLAANLAIIISLVMLISGIYQWVFPFVFLLKASADYSMAGCLLKFNHKRLPFMLFLFFSLLYPFVSAGIMIAANVGKFDWKGRHYKR